MQNRWCLGLVLLAGCLPITQTLPQGPATPQVASTPFAEPPRPAPTRVNYAPASQETSYRVLLIKDKLVGQNPQCGLRPYILAIGSADPEIFHVGLNHIYVSEGLVKQCGSEGQLAAVVAYELGRMVAEREASVGDEIRQPERLLPIAVTIGGSGSSRDRDPTGIVELAQYEKDNPKRMKKLPIPNPQLVARDILERAGFQRTELDAVMPALQNADRYRTWENQFKGTMQQGDWKQ